MFDFRRITLFCLEKRLSKHEMTIFSNNLGGHGPFVPLATPMVATGEIWARTVGLQSLKGLDDATCQTNFMASVFSNFLNKRNRSFENNIVSCQESFLEMDNLFFK